MISNLEQHIQCQIPHEFGKAVVDAALLHWVPLDPREEQCLSDKAVPKRKTEFMLGRAAAHKALEQLGVNNVPILKGKNRQPLWPDNTVGSITHKAGIAIAAAALRSQCQGIGIDLETCIHNVGMPFYRRICNDEELLWVFQKNEEHQQRLSMIFSAKEALYKLLNPLEGVFLGFKDVCLAWDFSINAFIASLKKNIGERCKRGDVFTVSCSIYEDLVFSSVFL